MPDKRVPQDGTYSYWMEKVIWNRQYDSILSWKFISNPFGKQVDQNTAPASKWWRLYTYIFLSWMVFLKRSFGSLVSLFLLRFNERSEVRLSKLFRSINVIRLFCKLSNCKRLRRPNHRGSIAPRRFKLRSSASKECGRGCSTRVTESPEGWSDSLLAKPERREASEISFALRISSSSSRRRDKPSGISVRELFDIRL